MIAYVLASYMVGFGIMRNLENVDPLLRAFFFVISPLMLFVVILLLLIILGRKTVVTIGDLLFPE